MCGTVSNVMSYAHVFYFAKSFIEPGLSGVNKVKKTLQKNISKLMLTA